MNKEETKRQIREGFLEQLRELARSDPDIKVWVDRWGSSVADSAVYGIRTTYPRWSMGSQLAGTDKRVRQAYVDTMQECVLRLREYPNTYIPIRP